MCVDVRIRMSCRCMAGMGQGREGKAGGGKGCQERLIDVTVTSLEKKVNRKDRKERESEVI